MSDFGKERPAQHNRPPYPISLPTLLRTSVKEVHEPDLAEHERQNCPTSFNLTPSPKGFGEARLPIAATDRRLWRCRAPHADGAVAEEIDTIKHSIRVINVVYIVFYAFTAHDRRRSFVARARQPAARGHVDRDTRDKASSCAASPLPVRDPAVA